MPPVAAIPVEILNKSSWFWEEIGIPEPQGSSEAFARWYNSLGEEVFYACLDHVVESEKQEKIFRKDGNGGLQLTPNPQTLLFHRIYSSAIGKLCWGSYPHKSPALLFLPQRLRFVSGPSHIITGQATTIAGNRPVTVLMRQKSQSSASCFRVGTFPMHTAHL
jgi:hypothetical protein